MSRATTVMAAIPTGILTRNIQRQPASAMIKPPTDGPSATPSVTLDPITPSARPALIGWEGLRNDRGAQRRNKHGAESLQRATGDQPVHPRGQAAKQRGDREYAQTHEINALAAVQIADAPGPQSQRSDDEQVDEYHPLNRGEGRAEVVDQCGQRDIHDAAVERKHEDAKPHADQAVPALRRGRRLWRCGCWCWMRAQGFPRLFIEIEVFAARGMASARCYRINPARAILRGVGVPPIIQVDWRRVDGCSALDQETISRGTSMIRFLKTGITAEQDAADTAKVRSYRRDYSRRHRAAWRRSGARVLEEIRQLGSAQFQAERTRDPGLHRGDVSRAISTTSNSRRLRFAISRRSRGTR